MKIDLYCVGIVSSSCLFPVVLILSCVCLKKSKLMYSLKLCSSNFYIWMNYKWLKRLFQLNTSNKENSKCHFITCKMQIESSNGRTVFNLKVKCIFVNKWLKIILLLKYTICCFKFNLNIMKCLIKKLCR